MSLIRDILGHYTSTGPLSETDVLTAAEDILRRRIERQGSLSSPQDASDFLRTRIGALDHEEFHVLWLDQRHRILGTECLFRGTIAGASVCPREVVKAALRINAAACILAHNHPSGEPEPSAADRHITQELVTALRTIEVRVLDHIVVGAVATVSLAGRGLM